MAKENNLERFVDAQEKAYPNALSEMIEGRKRSHWMWYIFPQIDGLGFSSTSRYYAIKDKEEAAAYLTHPLLGPRLIQICHVLLKHESKEAHQIFGTPDNLKLKSSMTLFALLPNTHSIFQEVLNAFFRGEKDHKTIALIEKKE